MKTTQLLICAVSAAAAFAAAQVQGQNFDVRFVEHTPFSGVSGTVNDGSFEQAWPSGVMRFEEISKATPFQAFCIEPTQAISYGEELTYQVQDPTTLASYDTIARLVGGYQESSGTALDAAAVHWAIWEVTSEVQSPVSLLDGNVRITNLGTSPNQAVADLGNAYLANVASFEPADVVVLTNADRQDVIAWGSPFRKVPEPGTMVLVALSGLGLLRRRR